MARSVWTVAMLLTTCGAVNLAAASPQTVGEVARVQEVSGVERQTESQRTWKLEKRESVRVGLTAVAGTTRSYISLSLDMPITVAVRGGRTPAWGTFDFQGIGEFTITEARLEPGPGFGRMLLGMLVPRGLLRMALSDRMSHAVSILTPQLTARPNGTYLRMFVDPIVGTFLAVDEGTVQVELPDDETFLVAAGHWLLVPPAGSIQRGAIDEERSALDDPPLLDCCDFRTDPPLQ